MGTPGYVPPENFVGAGGDVYSLGLTELARKMPTFEYDRTNGKFRSCLLGLINWRILDKLKTLVATIRTEMDEGRFGLA